MQDFDLLDRLRERGLIAQVTFEDELRRSLKTQKINFYVGFDPTADSLHAGHLLMLRIAKAFQDAGHTPFVVLGGGTGHVGDPSGRTDMRQLLSPEAIGAHVSRFAEQIKRFLSFSGPNAAQILDNADWLLPIRWVELLREIGPHVSVNRMLAAEAYKARWERGLTFLELNYMVMQAYDFLHLNRTRGVVLQIGGSDQWSNILLGADLIRRLRQTGAYCLTANLLTNSRGEKMGKTAGGALWLDPAKVSPYDFYQYWVNVDDADLKKLFLALTDADARQVAALDGAAGKRLAEAKRELAFLVTRSVHGQSAAELARSQSEAAFAGNDPEGMLETQLTLGDDSVAAVLVDLGLSESKSAARRLIAEGGVWIDGEPVADPAARLSARALGQKTFVIRKGKRRRVKVRLKE